MISALPFYSYLNRASVFSMFSDQMRRVSEVSFNNLPLDKSFKGKSGKYNRHGTI